MIAEEKLKKNWTEGASNYTNIVKRELEGPLKQAWLDIIQKNVSQKSGMQVLDVGTGPGFFAIIMELSGNNVTAIDCTEAMIEEAKRNTAEVGVSPKFYVMDSHKLDFKDESFDLIISRNVAWTLIDAKKAYTEWKRVLKKNGKILIFDANWNHRFYDEEYMCKYNEDMVNYEKAFNKSAPYITKEQEDYRKSMPMCARIRPQWDINTLLEIGLKTIYCDIDVTERLWSDEQKIMSHSTPMFMIAAKR
ncbi:class I SAM-dependent methyltransferase [Anaerovorax odorimutans]|uniref:class I SAM-dependent methyltransferase n=1 Tax=Anaerovorax odorimutans TaxID=109327 RepID=UPI000401D7D5|nr:class I SAM-dependent methyltransferase [Anaerovorax odorimutans]